MRIAFEDLHEWMEELEDYARYESEKEDDGHALVRTTIASDGDGSEKRVYLVCGFVVEDMLLHELVLDCGLDHELARMTDGTDKANTLRAGVVASAEALGVLCRGGRFQF